MVLAFISPSSSICQIYAPPGFPRNDILCEEVHTHSAPRETTIRIKWMHVFCTTWMALSKHLLRFNNEQCHKIYYKGSRRLFLCLITVI